MSKIKSGKANQDIIKGGSPVRRNLKWHFFLFLFSFLLFANCIPNDYNLDDELVTKNHVLTSKGVASIPEIFSSSYYKDQSGYEYEYRPIVLSSFAVEHQFFGDNATISHFINVFLYALVCVFIYLILLFPGLEMSPFLALFISVLFAAHSAHAEVVASIKNRDEILALLFSLASFYLALRSVNSGKRWRLIFVPIIFAFALMSKISALSFIFIIPAALIFFTELSWAVIFLLGVSLVLIATPFIDNSDNVWLKVRIASAYMIALAGLYVVFNISFLYKLIRSYTTDFFKGFKLSSGITYDNWGKVNLTQIKTDAMPGRDLLISWAALFSVVFTGIFVWNIIGNNLPYASVGFVLLCIMAISGRDVLVYWSNCMLSGCLIFLLWHYKLTVESGFGTAVFIVIIYQIFWGTKRLLFPSIFFLISAVYLSLSRGTSANPALICIFLIVIHVVVPYFAFKSKRLWLLLIPISILVLVIVVSMVMSSGGGHLVASSVVYRSILSLLVICALLIPGKVSHIIFVYRYGAIIFILGIYLFASFEAAQMPLGHAVNPLSAIQSSIQPKNVISNKQNRPLEYLELPVSPNDPIALRLGTSMEILYHYLHEVIIPYPMAFYYGYKFIKPERITNPLPLFSFFIYALLGILTFVFLKKDVRIGFGLFIYLVSVISVSTYFKPIPGMIGDRFLLIPSLGWVIILGALVFKILKIPSGMIEFSWAQMNLKSKVSLICLITFYSTITFARNLDWKDDLTLFEHDIPYVDESGQAHNLLALHLMQRSTVTTNENQKQALIREALMHFKRARNIYPPFFNATFDIGRVSSMLNEQDSAIYYFKCAISIDSTNSNSHEYIGNIMISQKKFSYAIPYLEYVIRHDSMAYSAYQSLGYCYLSLNSPRESIGVYKTAMRLLPAQPDPLINIARVYYQMNMIDSARQYLKSTLVLNPGNPTATSLLQQVKDK